MTDIIVYTAVFGGYDNLREPLAVGNTKYVAFTDQPIEAKGWEVRQMKRSSSAVKMARFFKTAACAIFHETEYMIWVDGSILPTIEPELIVESWMDEGGADIACFKHPGRNCAYDEARRCIVKGKDTKEILTKQIAFYQSEQFPEGYGLVETGVVVRRKTEPIQRLEKLWWEQIRDYSCRDQVSLPYCLWRLEIPMNIIEGSLIKHPWFSYVPHL